jgi:hypothetical protein
VVALGFHRRFMLWSITTLGGMNLWLYDCVGSQDGHACSGFLAWAALARLGENAPSHWAVGG